MHWLHANFLHRPQGTPCIKLLSSPPGNVLGFIYCHSNKDRELTNQNPFSAHFWQLYKGRDLVKFLCGLFDRRASKTMTDDAEMDSDFKAFVRRLRWRKSFFDGFYSFYWRLRWLRRKSLNFGEWRRPRREKGRLRRRRRSWSRWRRSAVDRSASLCCCTRFQFSHRYFISSVTYLRTPEK